MSRQPSSPRPPGRSALRRWLANLGGLLVVALMVAALVWVWGEGQRRMAVANLVASLSAGSRELFPVADEAGGGGDEPGGAVDPGAVEEVKRLRAEPLAVAAVADALRRAVGRGDESTARGALTALGEFDDAATPALPAVVEAVDRGLSWRVRIPAIDLMLRIGPDDPATVPALARALAATDLYDRDQAGVAREAARALGTLGPRAAPAVPHLARLLAHPDERLRNDTIDALGRIGPPAAGAVPRLIRLLGDPNSSAFTPAAVALARIAPDDPGVLEALEPLVNDPDGEVQALAREVVGRHEARQSGETDRDPAVEERPGGRKSSRPPAPSGPRM